jgi:hypothetical protein
MPAEVRARVVWATKPIENGLARVRAEPLTDDLIAQVTQETDKPLLSACRKPQPIPRSQRLPMPQTCHEPFGS